MGDLRSRDTLPVRRLDQQTVIRLGRGAAFYRISRTGLPREDVALSPTAVEDMKESSDPSSTAPSTIPKEETREHNKQVT